MGEGPTLLPVAGLLPDPLADSFLFSYDYCLGSYFLGVGLTAGLCSGLTYVCSDGFLGPFAVPGRSL